MSERLAEIYPRFDTLQVWEERSDIDEEGDDYDDRIGVSTGEMLILAVHLDDVLKRDLVTRELCLSALSQCNDVNSSKAEAVVETIIQVAGDGVAIRITGRAQNIVDDIAMPDEDKADVKMHLGLIKARLRKDFKLNKR
jgi:hypothetical protein